MMRNTGTLSLKNSYKQLQQKMWQISSQSYQINKENEILKGRINTQRVIIKKRKYLPSSIKNMEQGNQPTVFNKNFEQQYRRNAKLKQKIQNIEQKKRQIQKNSEITYKIVKKNTKAMNLIKKYKKKLVKLEFLSTAPVFYKKLQKQQVVIKQNIEIAQRKQIELLQKIKQLQQELDRQRVNNKMLGSDILSLIQEKSTCRKLVKSQKNMSQKSGNGFRK